MTKTRITEINADISGKFNLTGAELATRESAYKAIREVKGTDHMNVRAIEQKMQVHSKHHLEVHWIWPQLRDCAIEKSISNFL